MLEKLFDNRNIIKNSHYIVVCCLLFIGFFVRTIGFSSFPSGLNQDEASIGYEAYSILSTGIDRNGNSLPIHLVSWGSGQNALYAYLSIPFISFFGLNAFSVRIVNLIFSCITLVIFYLLFKLIFDKRKALVALAILAICPWSIMSARWGLESNIFPALFLLSVYFLIKSIYSSNLYFLISFLFLGISLYSYGTSYLIVPLFLLFTIPYLIHTKNKSLKNCLVGLAILLVISLPIAVFLIINHFDLPQLQISNITIPRLDSNRTSVIFNLFTSNFLSTITQNSLRLLNIFISQSDGNSYNVIPSFGTIYGISLPFFIIGLYNVHKHKKYKDKIHHYIFYVWIICSILLGMTSHVNINRLNILFIPMLYFVVLGIFDVNIALKSEFR
ncbi:MAG: glycosyltransferase family 39 protein, partial [Paludibacter sp.]